MKRWIWSKIGDPILLKVLSRMDHLSARREKLHSGAHWKPVAEIGDSVQIHKDATLTSQGRSGSLKIGNSCIIYGHFWLFNSAQINLGHHSFVGPGSRIWSANKISIGSYVLISHLVDIHDSNSHSIHWENRRQEVEARFDHGDDSTPSDVRTAQVTIEDDVWIGFKSSILKGVTVGRGAIVAAGSVVTHDVPPFTLVAGNPATVIRELPR